MNGELKLELIDDQWEYTYTDHDRSIARAMVIDDDGKFCFVRLYRNDDFGNAVLIESSGGGVEKGETPEAAVKRELCEELGAQTEIICKIGVVSDYYNLIHRHNINNYFLCRAVSFGERHLMPYEEKDFRFSTLRLPYEEAVREYEARSCTRLGKLIARRELPVLQRAKEILEGL